MSSTDHSYSASDFADLKAQVDAIRRDLKANTEATAELVELFRALQGWFKVAGWLGTFVAWAVKIAAAVGVCWAALVAFKVWLAGGGK
jgi:hypothetical protein